MSISRVDHRHNDIHYLRATDIRDKTLLTLSIMTHGSLQSEIYERGGGLPHIAGGIKVTWRARDTRSQRIFMRTNSKRR